MAKFLQNTMGAVSSPLTTKVTGRRPPAWNTKYAPTAAPVDRLVMPLLDSKVLPQHVDKRDKAVVGAIGKKLDCLSKRVYGCRFASERGCQGER